MSLSRPSWVLTFACVLAAQLLQAQNLNAASELNLGIAAYDRAKYLEAIDHLERAVTLDPNSVKTHFYLAEAYNGAYSEECDRECDVNERRRQRAVEEYKRVLEFNPSNVEALKALAWRHYRSAKPDEAERYYRKTLEVNPDDFEALYTLAVVQWTRSYQLRQESRTKLRIGRNEPLIDTPACIEIRIANLARIEESIALMKRAAEFMPSYDAEEYLSIFYRERSDIQCGDHLAYDQDTKTAIDWARRACETRRRPDRVNIACINLRCPPPAPPPPPLGQAGACPD